MVTVFVIGCVFSVHANVDTNKREDHMDRYRWMETDRSQTAEWLNRQSILSANIIHSLPWRRVFAKRLSSLDNGGSTISDIYDAGDNRFYLRSTPEYAYQRLFIKYKNDPERLIIDPPVGYGINFFSPSPDGKYISYGLSKNGFESTDIKIIRVSDGVVLKDSIPQVRYPNVVWAEDNQSFYYSLNDAAESKGRQTCGKVYLHRLGEGNDVSVFDWQSIDELKQLSCENINLYSSANSHYLLVYVSRSIGGYGGDLFLAKKNHGNVEGLHWRKIIDVHENISSFVYAGKWLYLAGYNSSSGYDISRLNLDVPKEARTKMISWSNGELTGLSTSRDSLYITYHDTGVHKFVRIPFEDINQHQNIDIPSDEEVSAVFPSNDREDILFTQQGWLTPPTIYRFTPHNRSLTNTGLIAQAKVSFSDYEVEERWVTTKDNVRIPLTLIHRKGLKRDETMPTWLTAYGAYGVSIFPDFDTSRLIWLEQGGAIAIAHVRGGGELGPAWHDGGRAGNKKNSINDFIRCAEYLIENKYTSPSKLVISGESAGGIVIGMAMTLRPELFSAVAIDVGMLNTSRLDKIPIGSMNFEEIGSPFTPQGKRDLLNIDAYEHLHAGTRYPPVLLTVGLHDQRVSPWQTAKFTARLQEINQRWNIPVLVLADKNGGHNASTYADADAKFIDTVSFFFWITTGQHPIQ